MKTQMAQLNYLKIAPRKVRLVASVIRGMTVQEAEAQLMLNPKRAAESVLKLLRSAVSNARNNKMDVDKLVVSEIRVDNGPMLKRFMPRAQGRATPIHKIGSHISIALTESEKEIKAPRFKISKPKRVKKSELKKMQKAEEGHEHTEEHLHKHETNRAEDKSKDIKLKENPSKVKRLFNRKAI